MALSEELKPCPFCGGAPEILDLMGVIKCGNCDMVVHTPVGLDEKQGARMWNSRSASQIVWHGVEEKPKINTWNLCELEDEWWEVLRWDGFEWWRSLHGMFSVPVRRFIPISSLLSLPAFPKEFINKEK